MPFENNRMPTNTSTDNPNQTFLPYTSHIRLYLSDSEEKQARQHWPFPLCNYKTNKPLTSIKLNPKHNLPDFPTPLQLEQLEQSAQTHTCPNFQISEFAFQIFSCREIHLIKTQMPQYLKEYKPSKPL